MTPSEGYEDIRSGVRALCAEFPDEYFRKVDAERGYPGDFVSALTKAIRKDDGKALYEHFARTRAIRKGIVEIGQDSPAPDFGRPHPELPHEPLPRPYAADEE